MHVTRFVWHTLPGAEGWLTSRAIRSANRWLDGPSIPDDLIEDAEPMEEAEEKEDKGASAEPRPAAASARPGALRRSKAVHKEATVQAEAFAKKAPKPKPAKPKVTSAPSTSTGKGVGGGSGAKSALDPAKVEKLREELKRSKQKIAGGAPPDPSPGGEDSGEGDDTESASSGSTGSGESGPAADPAPLTAGDTDEDQDRTYHRQSYKRWYYRRLSRTADPQRGRPSEQEEAIEEPFQEAIQGRSSPQGR